MPAYAIGHLTALRMGPGVVRYLEGIDATLAPFGGRFIIHGEPPEVKEGRWDGTLIVIAFPDIEAARGWYDSPAYREILPYRADNPTGRSCWSTGRQPITGRRMCCHPSCGPRSRRS